MHGADCPAVYAPASGGPISDERKREISGLVTEALRAADVTQPESWPMWPTYKITELAKATSELLALLTQQEVALREIEGFTMHIEGRPVDRLWRIQQSARAALSGGSV